MCLRQTWFSLNIDVGERKELILQYLRCWDRNWSRARMHLDVPPASIPCDVVSLLLAKAQLLNTTGPSWCSCAHTHTHNGVLPRWARQMFQKKRARECMYRPIDTEEWRVHNYLERETGERDDRKGKQNVTSSQRQHRGRIKGAATWWQTRNRTIAERDEENIRLSKSSIRNIDGK